MSAKVAFSIAAALGVALAACGGGGPPDAAKVYAEAGEKMAALTSYHVTVVGVVEVLPPGGHPGEEVEDFTGTEEIDVAPPDRMQLTYTISEEELPASLRGVVEPGDFVIIQIGDQSYFSPPESPDYFIPAEEDPPPGVEYVEFLAFFTALWTEIFDLTYVAEETVEGVSTHHLQGTLPPAVLEIIEPEEQHTESATVDLWVGVEDSLVRRLRSVEPGETNTQTFSRFNDEAISIEAPANALPAEELFAEQFIEDIKRLPADQQDCLREVWGEAVFEEFLAGTRLLTEEDFEQVDVCFAFESPEDVKREFESLSVEDEDCLRGVLGDDVFDELKAGARLPTADEFAAGEGCFTEQLR